MNIPQLEILELEALLVHEWYDNQRTWPLSHRLQQSSVLRNPPVVTPTQDDSQGYVVLDGANRVAALRVLGYPFILTQVVQPGDPGLRLRTWNHVILDIQAEQLITELRKIERLNLVSSEDAWIELPAQREMGVGIIQLNDGRVFALSAPDAGLHGRIEILNTVVNCYQHLGRLDRTIITEIDLLRSLFPALSALVIFPKFEIKDLIQLASTGWLLPPGITRTTIAPRALHVNYPLAELSKPGLLSDKNDQLQKFLRQRWLEGKVRYNADPTTFFDE